MRLIVSTVLFALGANAWRLNFYRGDGCRGEYRGSQKFNQLPGFCEELDVGGFSSVYVEDNGVSDIAVDFYDGEQCSGESIGFTTIEGCVTLRANGASSVKAVSL